MTLINLAPIPCVLVGGGWTIMLAPSKPPAWGRIVEAVAAAGTMSVEGHDVPLITKTPTSLEGFPPVVEGTVYVVPAFIAQVAWKLGRTDFAYPGEMTFDANRKPIGYKNLCVAPQA